MLSTVLTILGAIVTILGPILAAGVVAWADTKHTEYQHASMDETDLFIKQVVKGNHAGLVQLSRQLERLHREARRKRRDP